jgi:hypothetical protein
MTSNVSDADLTAAFKGSNFGRIDHRKLLGQSVFKRLLGYHCGHTITQIMHGLGLIGVNGAVTKKGKAFVGHAYHDELIHGG